MAAAEARAAWQRAANRCIVQEDAKRGAPKLPPCCSSSSSTQTHESANSTNAPNQADHHQVSNFAQLNWNPVGCTNQLNEDTKWWLQFQPNFGYQKEFVYYDQLNLVQDEKKYVEISCTDQNFDNFEKIDESGLENMWMVSTTFMKNGNFERKMDDKRLKCDIVKCFEDPLVHKKNEPWWRVNDEKELASMVALKAKENIENCDLPRPTQTLYYNCSDLASGVGRNCYEDEGLIYPPPSHKVFYPDLSEPCDPLDNANYFRRRTEEEEEKLEKTQKIDKNRAELLEALCHSQTRAREAELAARKSEDEKQDIIKLLFKQASHIFACKQWLKMLQLENMCLQLRLRDHPIPWLTSNLKDNKQQKEEENCFGSKKGKNKNNGNNICRYMVVFAVGLGLVGAGLLFGWTLGWLLPKL